MAQQRPAPSAAQALYPHLRQGTPSEVQQRRTSNSVADGMWPGLSREAKQREAEQARWANELAQRNKRLAADLRELRARLREGRR